MILEHLDTYQLISRSIIMSKHESPKKGAGLSSSKCKYMYSHYIDIIPLTKNNRDRKEKKEKKQERREKKIICTNQ